MRFVLVAAMLLAGPALLGGCSSMGDTSAGLGDFGSSVGGSVGHNSDTYGTQRRPDVNAYSTAPSLPTMGAVGYGK